MVNKTTFFIGHIICCSAFRKNCIMIDDTLSIAADGEKNAGSLQEKIRR